MTRSCTPGSSLQNATPTFLSSDVIVLKHTRDEGQYCKCFLYLQRTCTSTVGRLGVLAIPLTAIQGQSSVLVFTTSAMSRNDVFNIRKLINVDCGHSLTNKSSNVYVFVTFLLIDCKLSHNLMVEIQMNYSYCLSFKY